MPCKAVLVKYNRSPNTAPFRVVTASVVVSVLCLHSAATWPTHHGDVEMADPLTNYPLLQVIIDVNTHCHQSSASLLSEAW